ncbi:hypothetical protein SAMN00790413_04243 [Deinococcus hopiensis KR-140]|uniref:Uncharacterized protein n=1 Tax=Deinococcus hopiensis KR-140 TaxID=695939 RepID=A0A1W1UPK0_9DEIO|nr:hypothetical protein SAMN00790413_04243 [Deinococcus hopiensis KR-140]
MVLRLGVHRPGCVTLWGSGGDRHSGQHGVALQVFASSLVKGEMIRIAVNYYFITDLSQRSEQEKR